MALIAISSGNSPGSIHLRKIKIPVSSMPCRGCSSLMRAAGQGNSRPFVRRHSVQTSHRLSGNSSASSAARRRARLSYHPVTHLRRSAISASSSPYTAKSSSGKTPMHQPLKILPLRLREQQRVQDEALAVVADVIHAPP